MRGYLGKDWKASDIFESTLKITAIIRFVGLWCLHHALNLGVALKSIAQKYTRSIPKRIPRRVMRNRRPTGGKPYRGLVLIDFDRFCLILVDLFDCG